MSLSTGGRVEDPQQGEVEDGARDVAGEGRGRDEPVDRRSGGGATAGRGSAEDLSWREGERLLVGGDSNAQRVPPVSGVGGKEGGVYSVIGRHVRLCQTADGRYSLSVRVTTDQESL